MSQLSDEQLLELDRITMALRKIKEAVGRVNGLIADTSLPIRLVQDFTLALPANDISQILFSHELTIKRLNSEAMARLEKAAA